MGLVKPKKFLGQHFLRDLGIANDIADTVDACPNLPVLEVGPGMGVLTQFLMKKDREVKVVELDFESVAYLKENFTALEGHIIEDDFLKLKLENIFEGKPFVLTGNYPYNISSQIFFKMLDYKDLIPCCTGMIQKEVAERIGLEEAEVILAAGRGVGSAEGYKTVEAYANEIGAVPAASRAIVDAGWVPYAYQVGQTGKIVSPRVYIACGISGAMNHTMGMSGSDCIIAINKDPEAPIFDIADYGIVGDLFEVLPAFVEAFKAFK